MNSVDDVMGEWSSYVVKEREKELGRIIQEEHLKEPETRKFVEKSFRDGEVKTEGTEIASLMQPMSHFTKDRKTTKQRVIDKLKAFFERFFGIGGSVFKADKEE